MVKIPLNIQSIIDRYIEELKRSDIKISHAFIFGSYAKGNQNEFSDIDIALISDQFTGNRYLDRNLVREITLNVSNLIEIMPFTSEEFNSSNPFANEIMETGIRIM